MSSEGSLAPVMCPPGCNQISGLVFKLQGLRLCFCFFPEHDVGFLNSCRALLEVSVCEGAYSLFRPNTFSYRINRRKSNTLVLP